MKSIFITTLAILNFLEGGIHIITAIISYWGIIDIGVWDWRVAASPTADIFLGFVSLITGFVLGNWGCCHKNIPQNDK